MGEIQSSDNAIQTRSAGRDITIINYKIYSNSRDIIILLCFAIVILAFTAIGAFLNNRVVIVENGELVIEITVCRDGLTCEVTK